MAPNSNQVSQAVTADAGRVAGGKARAEFSLGNRDGQFTREDLISIDPLTVDRRLPEIATGLGAPDDELASRTENVVVRHPLFGLRKGLWAPPATPASLQRVFFSERQITAAAIVLTRLVKGAVGAVRSRLVEMYSRFPGLDNLVNWRTLPWTGGEREYFEHLLLRRSLREFKRQLTIVLSYRCNQRCPYCFSNALLHRHPQDITWENFIGVLEWGRRAGVARVPVAGGEPTLHPAFSRMMSELRSRNLTTCFSTNGCVPRSEFEGLSPDLVEAVTFHILDDTEYAPGQTEQLEENIRCVRDQGIPLIFRYVLAGNRPPARYLDLAARYRPRMLTFSPVFPGPHRQEMNRDVRAMFALKDDILGLAQAAADLRIRPVVAKPIPLCMFSREEFLRLAAMATLDNVCDVSQNQYTNNTLVNPDRSLFPCMALPLTDARLSPALSPDQFAQSSRRAVEPLQQTPMLAECAGCQMFYLQLCQPACLAFVAGRA
jgi:MoaA/NifB/PqqE/SkfB family radical SAM enzyme